MKMLKTLPLFLFSAVFFPLETLADLPPLDCVRQVREAKILGAQDPNAELKELRRAAKNCPDQIAPVLALLDLQAAYDLLEDAERQELEETLTTRISDPENPPSPSVVRQMLWSTTLDPRFFRAAAEAMEARLLRDDVEVAERIGILSLLQELRRRVGDLPAEADATERLYALEPSERTRILLIDQYRELERWENVADLLGELVETGSRHLRGRYIDVLSRTDRVDELQRQVGIFFPSGAEAAPTVGDYALLSRVAWNLHDMGRDDAAEGYFRRMLADQPDSTHLRNVVLHLYGSSQERAAHAAALEQQWESEADPRALFDEGTQRLTMGDAEGAVELLERAAPHFPQMEALWYNLAMAAWKTERWETSATSYARAAELNPTRADAFFFGGLAWVELDRCEEAIVALLRAVEMDPSRSLAHYHLARCYASIGDREAATKHRALYDESR